MIVERPGAPPRTRHRAYTTLGVIALLLLLVAVSWRHYSSFHWAAFFGTLSALDRRWVLAGLGFAFLSYLGRAARWKLMMLPSPSRLANLFCATLIGFSAVVLFGRPGEVVRPILIAKREGSTVPAQAAIWLLERLYDLLLILVLFGLGLAEAHSFQLRPGSTLTPVLRAGGGVIACAAAGASAILYMLARHPETCKCQILRALSFLPDTIHARVEHVLGSFLHGTKSVSKPRVMISSVLLTFFEWGIILAAVWCFLHSHPASKALGVLDVAVYLGFVSIGNIVQLPGIGGGVQIASILVLTELFHMPIEVATGLSLLIWAGSALIVLPFGIPLALAGHLRFADFRQKLDTIDGGGVL